MIFSQFICLFTTSLMALSNTKVIPFRTVGWFSSNSHNAVLCRSATP